MSCWRTDVKFTGAPCPSKDLGPLLILTQGIQKWRQLRASASQTLGCFGIMCQAFDIATTLRQPQQAKHLAAQEEFPHLSSSLTSRKTFLFCAEAQTWTTSAIRRSAHCRATGLPLKNSCMSQKQNHEITRNASLGIPNNHTQKERKASHSDGI